MSAFTTKTALKTLLKPLSGSTLRLIAIQVNCVVHKGNASRTSHNASHVDLTDFLFTRPVAARKAADFLENASKTNAYAELVNALRQLKFAGPMKWKTWTFTPVSNSVIRLEKDGQVRGFCTQSTDERVGLILMASLDASQATQLSLAPEPPGEAKVMLKDMLNG